MSTDTQTPEIEEIDKTFPAQEADDGSTEILHDGKGLKRSSFADTLDKKTKEPKAEKPTEKTEATQEAAAPRADAFESKDPIAEKIAEKKAEAATEDKPKSLLVDALNKAEAAKAKKTEEATAKDAKAEDASAITEKDIEDELKNPHSSEKKQARIRWLHKQWKEADAKAATSAKSSAEKDAKLQELEKKLSEAGKAAGVAPEVQAQLDELQQYRRQYEVENSPRYKEFNDAYEATESAILATLKNAGIKLKGGTWEQTEAYIKEIGGFAAFQEQHPELAEDIRETRLNISARDKLVAALNRQDLLKEAKSHFVKTEKSGAKEYFAKVEAEKKAAAEAAPKPEVEKQARKAKLENWHRQTISEVELFKDAEAPAEASEEARTSIKQQNELKAFLRSNLAANLNLDSEEDVARVALDATLAHFFKKQTDGLYAENEQLRAELKKVKTAGKTIVKGTQTPAPINDKPAKTFEEQLERSLARKGA